MSGIETRGDYVAEKTDSSWAWPVLSFGATGVSQLATQILIGRSLGSYEFSIFFTILSFMNLVSVPLMGVQISTARAVAAGEALGPIVKQLHRAGLFMSAVLVLSLPIWSSVLEVREATSAALLGCLYVPVSILVCAARGNAAGRGLSRHLAIAVIVGAVSRPFMAVVGADVKSVSGAVAGIIISEIAVMTVLFATTPHHGRVRRGLSATETTASTASQVAVWLLGNATMLWAHRSLGGDLAGAYLAASSISLGIVALGQAYVWHAAARMISMDDVRAAVRKSVLIVTVLTVPAFFGAALLLPPLLGKSFESMTEAAAWGVLWSPLVSVLLSGVTAMRLSGRAVPGIIYAAGAVSVVLPPVVNALVGGHIWSLALAGILPASVGAAGVALSLSKTADENDAEESFEFSSAVINSSRVSVIVTTKNSERTLKRCLLSLRSQVGCEVEIVVVDNFSTDGTRDIAEDLADVLITAGPERSAQRNIGVETSTGDVIAVLDSDMVVEPGVLAEAARQIACGASSIVIPEESFGNGFWARCKALEKSIALRDPAVEAARVFTRESFSMVSGYDERLTACEDWDLSDRISHVFGPPGRTTSKIWHDEGDLKLRGTFSKKRYYGKWVSKWAKNAPNHRLSRNVGRALTAVLSNPFVGGGLIIMKTVEAIGFASGARDARREGM